MLGTQECGTVPCSVPVSPGAVPESPGIVPVSQALCQAPGEEVLVSPRGCQCPQGLCQCCQEEWQFPKHCARSSAGCWCPWGEVCHYGVPSAHTRVCSSVPVSPGLCQVLGQAGSGQ